MMESKFLAQLLDYLYDQVAVISKEGRILYFNQAFESFLILYQKDNPQIINTSINEIFVSDLKPLIAMTEECVAQRTIISRIVKINYINKNAYFKVVTIPINSGSRTTGSVLILYNNSEAELKKKELYQQIQFHKALVKQLPVGVFMFDLIDGEHTFSLWNPKMEQYFGYSESQIIGQPCSRVFDENMIRRHQLLWGEKNNNSRILDIPAEYIQTKGGMRYFHTIIAAINSFESQVLSFLCIMEDVTEKIQSELKLKRYQRELKIALRRTSEKLDARNAEMSSILENSYGISIFSLDVDLKYRVFNKHHQDFIARNYKIDIAENLPFPREMLKLRDRESRFSKLVHNALGGKNITNEMSYVFPVDGEVFMDGVFSPMYSGEEIIGVTIVLIDTTESRQVRNKAVIFQSVADNADYGVFLTDLSFNINYANRSFFHLFHEREDPVIGLNLGTLISSQYLNAILQDVTHESAMFKKGQLEVIVNENDEDRRTLLLNFVPYTHSKEHVTGISFTVIDITPMKHAQETLQIAKENAERSSLLKSSFVANMSHEIRTPLNSILGFADLMEGKLETPKMESYVQNIRSSGKLLKGLINDILDFSKIEAGKMSYKPSEVPVDSFFFSLYKQFNTQAESKGLAFSILSLGAIPVTLEFDSLRLNQILNNLIGNALKFTPWGMIKVLVRYSILRSCLYISVVDTGIGVSREDQFEVFNPFEQQEKLDSRNYEGTGLGLTITKKLIDIMGGRIKLISRIGEGCRFVMSLPMKADQTGSPTFLTYREQDEDLKIRAVCLIDSSLLSGKMQAEGLRNQIRFIAVNPEHIEEPLIEKSSLIILRGESFPVSFGQLTPVYATSCEMYPQFLENGMYCFNENCTEIHIISILKSILKTCSQKKTTPRFNFSILNSEDRKNMKEAFDSRNIESLKNITPLLRRCQGKDQSSLMDNFDNAIHIFDIPVVNEILEIVNTQFEAYCHNQTAP